MKSGFVAAPVLEGGRDVARGGQRAHRAERNLRRERISDRKAPPPRYGIIVSALSVGGGCERNERVHVCAPKPVSLDFDPAIELRRAFDEDTVEKGTGVRLNCVPDPAGCQCAIEVPEVDADDGGVQSQLVLANDQRVLPQRAAKGIDGLGECVARPLLVALGPEKTEEPVAADAPGIARGDNGEEAEASALYRRAREWMARPLDRQPTERPESEHPAPSDTQVITR